MAQYSPELIEQTISVFENRTSREIFQEEARQAVENISCFFWVLQEWFEAEDKEECQDGSDGPIKIEGCGTMNPLPGPFLSLFARPPPEHYLKATSYTDKQNFRRQDNG